MEGPLSAGRTVKRKTICVVDDDPSVLSSLERLLDSDGFDAQTFNSPEVFLDYAREHAITLVVLDIAMPVKNGIEVQKQLREFSPKTRVVMMTGREEPALRAVALQGGAFAFLVKPFEDHAFLAAIHGALRHAA
jgi:FixJ family two-component response regulator